MKTTSLMAWLQSPTTVGGISGLVGVAAGLLSGGVSLHTALPLATTFLVAMILPDNTQAKVMAAQTVTDLDAFIESIVTKTTTTTTATTATATPAADASNVLPLTKP